MFQTTNQTFFEPKVLSKSPISNGASPYKCHEFWPSPKTIRHAAIWADQVKQGSLAAAGQTTEANGISGLSLGTLLNMSISPGIWYASTAESQLRDYSTQGVASARNRTAHGTRFQMTWESWDKHICIKTKNMKEINRYLYTPVG